MCHFLTIAVAGKRVPEVPKEFRRTIHFAEQTNLTVTCHTPSGWISFNATLQVCSYKLYRSASSPSEDRSKLEKKYRKKGWSASKIQRVLKSHEFSLTPSAGLRNDFLDVVGNLTKSFGDMVPPLCFCESKAKQPISLGLL